MKNHTQSASQRGFSIIELLMVIAIIAIMSAVALPFFGAFIDNRNLKTAARDIAGDVFETRERAISENRLYQILFDPVANTYQIKQCLQSNDPFCNNGYSSPLPKSLSTYGSGVKLTTITFVGNLIQFQPRGTIDIGAVTLTNKRTSTAKLTTTPTGRTYVDWTGLQ